MKTRFICESCGRSVPYNAEVCTFCGRLFSGDKCPLCGRSGNPEEFKNRKVKEYKDLYTNTMALASTVTYVNDVIEPAETRRCLTHSLRLIKGKKILTTPKKHGNIPL